MPAQQPMVEAGTEVSRYRVEKLIARGGMGLVYRARDIRLDRPVALKLLSPELSDDERFRERFVRESRLAAAVDHPNVIPVYEADDWQGALYIAMRFVEGVDLHTVLATSGRLDPATALPLLGQAADALDAAHRVGLVHRDVKPGNFMLAGATAERVPPTTHVYLTDFGLTKRASSVSGLTRTGQFLGSLHYVAPEQIKGEDVDARTDVYALACVAYEVFAGRPVFDIDGEAGLLWAHMSVAPAPLTSVRSDLPDGVDEVLARAMAKDRGERPDSCGEFSEQLRAALATSPSGSLPGLAAPTYVTGAPGASTAPHGLSGQHPSFPPQDPAQVRSSTVHQQRTPTPVQGLAGWGAPVAGWEQSAPQGSPTAPPPVPGPVSGAGGGAEGPGGPGGPGGPAGPPPPAWTPQPGQAGAPRGGGGPARGKRTALLVALVAVVVLVGVGLLIWRPWSGPSLVPRDLVVVPYRASLPDDWQTTTETVDATYSLFGTKNWSGLINDDEDTLADAEKALTEDPESLVYLYVDPSDSVFADTPADAASQLQGLFSNGGRLVEQGTRDVAGRKGLEVGGVVQLGEKSQLRLYAVAVKDDPRMLMVFLCPPSLYDEWRPTFDEIVDSVVYTG
jgi:serine/threonine protein kinase